MDSITSILAVDPGTTISAWVHFSMNENRVLGFGTLANELLVVDLPFRMPDMRGLSAAHLRRNTMLVVEKMTGYGKPVGESVFETCFWTGRFVQAWGGNFVMYPRRRVKIVLLGKDKGDDKHVRAAGIAWFGGKEKAIGNKAAPGQLHKMKEHEWQALGIALAYARELRSGVAPPAVTP